MELNSIVFTKVRIPLENRRLDDIPAAVSASFAVIEDRVRPGMRIAITCGSRGISNIALIIKSLVSSVKAKGAEPFIVPAMGSHGGATAKGQAEVLRGYGVYEEAVGAPIVSSMEVVKLGTTKEPPHLPVYMDKNAYESDGVIVVNRVKAHTDFHGPHESGIVKMLTIGLGKHAQALAVHSYGVTGLRDYIPYVSQAVIDSGKIIGGLAILEDGLDNTADIEIAPAEGIFELDSRFLARSKALMAQLPFSELDVLVVDEMGKDYSGTGMDPNVIGRVSIDGQEDGKPHCRSICVLGLSEASHGNALGVGLADVATKRLADSIDWPATRANVVTSGFLKRGAMPVTMETDRKAIELSLKTCGTGDIPDPRIVRIKNTLQLQEIYVSPALLGELPPGSEIIKETTFEFDEEGNIAPF